MIRRVKNWLGIESVKVDMELPPAVTYGQENLKGILKISSMSSQTVEYIEINFIEKYERGRREDKRINDYLIGQWTSDEKYKIGDAQKLSIPFTMKLDWLESDMDQWQRKNFITDKLIKLAKWSRKVKSTFRIETELQVKGAKLHPFFKAEMDVLTD
jgi:hypothetical protein